MYPAAMTTFPASSNREGDTTSTVRISGAVRRGHITPGAIPPAPPGHPDGIAGQSILDYQPYVREHGFGSRRFPMPERKEVP